MKQAQKRDAATEKAKVITVHWSLRKHSEKNGWYSPVTHHGVRVIKEVHYRVDTFNNHCTTFGIAKIDGQDQIVQRENLGGTYFTVSGYGTWKAATK